MAWTPLDESISAGQAGHITDHEQVHAYLNNDFDISWGEGYVHPSSGSDSYDGTSRRYPKASVTSAVSAGFAVIHIAAGTYAGGSWGTNRKFVFYPGTHSITSTVTATTPVFTGRYPVSQSTDQTGYEAVLQASSSRSDLFDIGGSNLSWGGRVSNLKFNTGNLTASVAKFTNVNMFHVEDNVSFYSSSWNSGCRLVHSIQTAATGKDSSWCIVQRNHVIGNPLLYADNVWGWVNRWTISDNKGYSRNNVGSTGTATTPFMYLDGRHTGHTITGNSFEGATSPAAASIYAPNACEGFYYAGNRGEKTYNTNNIYARFDDLSNSFVEHSLGSTSAVGNLHLNGTLRSSAYVLDPDSDTTYRNTVRVNGRVDRVS